MGILGFMQDPQARADVQQNNKDLMRALSDPEFYKLMMQNLLNYMPETPPMRSGVPGLLGLSPRGQTPPQSTVALRRP